VNLSIRFAQTPIGFVSLSALRRHSWIILSKPPSGSFRAAGIGFVSPDGPPGAGGFGRGNRPALADHSSLPTAHSRAAPRPRPGATPRRETARATGGRKAPTSSSSRLRRTSR
jgi:hypothetical protein